jgi:broad specificity phosphatase PhoE
MRFDAADQTWHLSTPTPYDPPLTYGGWNQSRALGVRIASLLHAREQEAEASTHHHGSTSTQHSSHGAGANLNNRKRKRKHRVVIHSSPFSRCLQTSVAIAAGMAQFEPPREAILSPSNSRPNLTRYRTAAQLYSATARFRSMDPLSLAPHLASIAEPRNDFAHDLARKSLQHGYRRHRQAKMRVDPFLGEWMNPQYFEHITPPPPSCMMLATAKSELMHDEPVDVYIPNAPTKQPSSNLWNGTHNHAGTSRESPLDDWSSVHDGLTMAGPSHRRDRASSTSSVGSNDNGSTRSPFRSGHVLQPLKSTFLPLTSPNTHQGHHQHHNIHHGHAGHTHHPAPESVTYTPPTPSYSVSTSDHIPRGYVSHARNACVNVDRCWDSSRPPLNWGDGGELGEEWSSMHRRFRRGLNNLMEWYSQHNADDRGEDALGFEQAEGDQGEEDEQEDLVLILVTHAAGCNALIGALTNQPVLLDVGMASLTMAVRREETPGLIPRRSSAMAISQGMHSSPADSPAQSPANFDGERRRSSNLDIGLSNMYDMKFVASSEHLRAGADPSKSHVNASNAGSSSAHSREHGARSRRYRAGSGSDARRESSSGPDRHRSRSRSNTSTALGSIRRPSLQSGMPSRQPSRQNSGAGGGLSRVESFTNVIPVFSTSAGLWQPPGSGSASMESSARNSPALYGAGEISSASPPVFTPPPEERRRPSIQHNMMLDFANSPPDSRVSSPQMRPALILRDSNEGGLSPFTRPKDENDDDDDDKSTQRDSVLGASESHDHLLTMAVPPKDDAPLVQSAAPTKIAPLEDADDHLADRPTSLLPPPTIRRGLSQRGIWGSNSSGTTIVHRFTERAKRRWSSISGPTGPLTRDEVVKILNGESSIDEKKHAEKGAALPRSTSTSQLHICMQTSAKSPLALQPSFSHLAPLTAPSSPLCREHDLQVPQIVQPGEEQDLSDLPTLPEPPADVPKFALLPPPAAVTTGTTVTTLTTNDDATKTIRDDTAPVIEEKVEQREAKRSNSAASPPAPAKLWQPPTRNSGISA